MRATPRLTECADRGMIGVLFEIVSAAWKLRATWRSPKTALRSDRALHCIADPAQTER
jgi:hypothetical protein